jgi:hypothetical protein
MYYTYGNSEPGEDGVGCPSVNDDGDDDNQKSCRQYYLTRF